MNVLVNFLFQSVACSLVFYGIYYWLLRNESCHAFNRYYLLLSAFFSLTFPLLRFNSPLSFSPEVTAVVTLPELVLGDNPAYPASAFSWLWVVYVAGALLFAAKLIAKLYSLRNLVRSGEKHNHNDYILIPTKGTLPTFSFMKYLFWDDSQALEEKEKGQILRHELAHIQKKHSIDLLLMEVFHALLWFNPLMYPIKSALAITHEFEADEKAAEGQQVEVYQQLLARQVLSQYGLSLGSHFNQSQTLKRLRMLTNKNANVYWGKLVLSVVVFLLVFGAVSCEHSALENEDEIALQNEVAKDAQNLQQDGSGEIFTVVEDQPEPPGGIPSFYSYISENLFYPAQARRMGIEGKVFVQFIVDTDGSITEVQAIKGIGAGCDTEAVKIVANSPKWQPGRQNGKAVKVRMILPISFKLDHSEEQENMVDLDLNP